MNYLQNIEGNNSIKEKMEVELGMKQKIAKKGYKKENRGITLVALVVTIIVLLILAGVTIMTLFGDNGLINMAQKAKSETENAQANAIAGLGSLTNEMNSILNGSGTGGGTGTGGDTEGGGSGGGDGTGMSASDITTATNKNEYYGKKVNYTVGNSELQTALNTAGVTWKLFYADSEHIYLIASDYVPNANIPTTKGNTTTALTKNGTYKAYWNTAALGDYYDSATSTVTMNTLYQTLNKNHYDYLGGSYPNNSNIKAVAYMLDKDAWAGYKDSTNKADFVIGGPTVEMLMASYNQTHGDVRASDNKPKYQAKASSETGYQISQDYGDNWANYYSGMLSTSDSLYINDTGTTNANGYWLASPSALNTPNVMYVHYNGYVYNGSYFNDDLGFRPVVSLKSGIRLEPVYDTDGTTIVSFEIK